MAQVPCGQLVRVADVEVELTDETIERLNAWTIGEQSFEETVRNSGVESIT
jgi:hypothetical protein